MTAKELAVQGRRITLWGDTASPRVFIQPVDQSDLEAMEGQCQALATLCGHRDWCIAALSMEDWNRELTPWTNPPVFGKTGFGDGAGDTLSLICTALLPALEDEFPVRDRKIYLCGYSLAGLFALWSGYQTTRFAGIAAVSPSVWYPGWIDYAREHPCMAQRVYLSLGDREEKAKNKVMATVGKAIRLEHRLLTEQGVDAALEWNSGNHFVDSDRRMALGLAWLLEK